MNLRSRRGWFVGIALLAAGCLSPTLPLPPPAEPTVTATDVQGLVRLSGTVEPDCEIFALNRNTNLITGQYTPSGAYDFPLQGHENDAISLWYLRGTDESPANEFLLKLPPPPTP